MTLDATPDGESGARPPADADTLHDPDVHVDWHMTPAEWRELRAVLTGVLDPVNSPYILRLKASGALQ